MQPEERPTTIARAIGLGRLTLVLVVSILGIAGFWHAIYGASLPMAMVVIAEIAVMLTLAFAYAWRSTR